MAWATRPLRRLLQGDLTSAATLKAVAEFQTDLGAGILEAGLIRDVLAPIVKRGSRTMRQERTGQPHVEKISIILPIHCQARHRRLEGRRAVSPGDVKVKLFEKPLSNPAVEAGALGDLILEIRS